MRNRLGRAARGAGHVVARIGRVVSSLLVGMDGRPLPPAERATPPTEHRP